MSTDRGLTPSAAGGAPDGPAPARGGVRAGGRDAGAATPEELRTLFLFEHLDTDELAWLSDRGRLRDYDADTVLYAEGEPALEFFVMIEGELVLTRRVQDGDVELVRTDYRGAYCGATQAYLGDRAAQVYFNAVRLVRPTRFFVLPAEDFARVLREWFPMAMHLLEGLFLGLRNSETVVGQRERLLALGQLSAGLTHELNNPAAAAVRATSALRERVAGMRHKLAMIADGEIDGERMARLARLQEDAVDRAAKAPRLSPLEAGDLEEELTDWADAHGVTRGYELAPVFAGAGLGTDWAEEVAASVGAAFLEPALRWLAYTVETEALMREIEDATTRISTLLGAVQQYSHMDRMPFEPVDVREGLESTLAILGHKLPPAVTVVRDYAPGLPRVPAFGGELNQVWTNLIDNALAAMGPGGTLTLRTRRVESPDGGAVEVEVGDTGPGVPEGVRGRIFEPFFTTKPVGEGTGLGLDISWRIVVSRHRGDISVASSPGDTRFTVRLPLRSAQPS